MEDVIGWWFGSRELGGLVGGRGIESRDAELRKVIASLLSKTCGTNILGGGLYHVCCGEHYL